MRIGEFNQKAIKGIAGDVFGGDIIVRLLASVILIAMAGCVMDRQGNQINFRLDKDEFQSKELQRFKLPNGNGVLRQTSDNRFQIKLYDRLKIYDLGQIPAASIVDTKIIKGETIVALQLPQRGCEYSYQFLRISEDGIFALVPQNECVKLDFGSDENVWVAKQSNQDAARFWVMRDQKFFADKEKSAVVQPVAVSNNRTAAMSNNRKHAASTPARRSSYSDTPNPSKGMLSRVDIQTPSKIEVGGGTESAPVRVVLRDAK